MNVSNSHKIINNICDHNIKSANVASKPLNSDIADSKLPVIECDNITYEVTGVIKNIVQKQPEGIVHNSALPTEALNVSNSSNEYRNNSRYARNCDNINSKESKVTASENDISKTTNLNSTAFKVTGHNQKSATGDSVSFAMSCDSPNLEIASTPSNSSYIDNRFTPGFTPKAKKRKCPGPAGFLEFVSVIHYILV